MAFLNIGLYFILYYITPVIAGLMCGVLLRDMRKSVLAGYTGSFIAFFPLFVFLETADVLTILIAAGIISVLGGLGGFLGSLVSRRFAT